jgi:hypothetical protein
MLTQGAAVISVILAEIGEYAREIFEIMLQVGIFKIFISGSLPTGKTLHLSAVILPIVDHSTRQSLYRQETTTKLPIVCRVL